MIRILSTDIRDHSVVVDVGGALPLPLGYPVAAGDHKIIGKVVGGDRLEITDAETFRLVANGILTKLEYTTAGLYLSDSGAVRKSPALAKSRGTDHWGFPVCKSLSPGAQRRNRTRALAGRLFDSELREIEAAIRRSE